MKKEIKDNIITMIIGTIAMGIFGILGVITIKIANVSIPVLMAILFVGAIVSSIWITGNLICDIYHTHIKKDNEYISYWV